jgi:signal transduction histidine kinase
MLAGPAFAELIEVVAVLHTTIENQFCPDSIDMSRRIELLENSEKRYRRLFESAKDGILILDADTGKVTIETGNTVSDEQYCTDHFGFVKREYVMLAISDNGCGRDNETIGQIFEPFFTSKGVDQGTGLGLSMVHGIVKQNNGFINVYSEPGKGTTFRIYLPRDAGQSVVNLQENVAQYPPGHGETVLVVEDEPELLALDKKILEKLE